MTEKPAAPVENIKRVAVIGGGPAGLMAAEVISAGGVQVDVYDAMPSVGRKFLLAGVGGLNITHSEPFAQFVGRYGARADEIGRLLAGFDADAVCEWVHGLGIKTFIGSSGRVFPADMKAAPLLRAWLHRLRESGVVFHRRHRCMGWNADGDLCFDTPDGEQVVRADAVVLALGGGSWARLGSDGAWVSWLAQHDVRITALQPANCGFDIAWSGHLQERFAGAPLKSVVAFYRDVCGNGHQREGECVISATGIEGSLVYALSSGLREVIAVQGHVDLFLDMAPHRTQAALETALAHPRGKASLANHWRKAAGIDGVKAALLREVLSPEACSDAVKVAAAIKQLRLRLLRTRPLDEAISTAGGVCFDAMNEGLMLNEIPGVFCAGEMLDWEAPTGGYLLTACLASGRAAGRGVLSWLQERP